MNIQKIIDILKSGGIEEQEAKAEVKLLLEKFCNTTVTDIIMGKEIDESQLAVVIQKAQERAQTRKPIQHILGYGYFMGEKFEVSPNTLIPRDETEILVRKSVEIINQNKYKFVMDVGTGTGCIACMIAKLASVKVIGLDISNEALQIALNNASRMNLFNKAIFRKSDIFSNVKDDEKFDMVISNPPYIPLKEKENIQKEVTFDPDLALYTNDDDGLEFYKKIIPSAKRVLNSNAHIALEIGYGQSEAVRELLIENNYENIGIEKDLAGIDRVIFANLK
ncbi:peptide chain release factor N(5)-glutamine methyltransferase [bacterium]|nr:peptide chain release factor N(5)-glutamine methyltransferase [bacterium]